MKQGNRDSMGKESDALYFIKVAAKHLLSSTVRTALAESQD
jgi:hypothetical protein